jgi:hypothetical protein
MLLWLGKAPRRLQQKPGCEPVQKNPRLADNSISPVAPNFHLDPWPVWPTATWQADLSWLYLLPIATHLAPRPSPHLATDSVSEPKQALGKKASDATRVLQTLQHLKNNTEADNTTKPAHSWTVSTAGKKKEKPKQAGRGATEKVS